ncbi:4-(cytidine 5'-diphospho)-2-C-methyl-D-erythritol kinase [Calidithermus roseus]|uniref:4-diphosphocytidyl-2-C-methyl-D-erythritol kinase n=1 Tax=Calidithermus roseus TaxID=1644118 RepID=A0A399F2W0_9DEIN|nr:4-(cytidine 5'-diphospho)-2-C-methyl-D-erythritol kinase [Calidithermus roseus]RIH88951.1 4-diphosphocytidyl-2-C-methyl-D-erythritol kinase [Calidithermus roseus]
MELLAPAKVNLGLSVVGRLENGYHELHTLFAALDLGDRLIVEARPAGIGLEVSGAELSSGPDNLVYKAAQAYLEAAGWPGGVWVRLEKRLPLAAGLGGGSSDAAAVLRALSSLYPAPLDLPAIARKLGADVPFFLLGGMAEGRGAGERLRPVEVVEAHLVLVNPGIAVSAAAAYGALRPEEWGGELDVRGILEALRSGHDPPYWNSLEAPVFRLEPAVAELKLHLKSAGLRGVLMSGSGSSVFGLAPDADAALFLARQLQARFPCFWVRAARTVGSQL